MKYRASSCVWVALFIWAFTAPHIQAQDTGFDPSWYDPNATYVKVGVVEDGMYRITGSDLSALNIPLSSISPNTLKVLRNGEEVPLHYVGNNVQLEPEAEIYFVGHRNTGEEEAWAYRDNPEWQSSTYYSLFSDTTFYWLTWGGERGDRYTLANFRDPSSFPQVNALRDTLHIEADELYNKGDGNLNAENPFYTRGEGYYFNRRFTHTQGSDPITQSYSASIVDPLLTDDLLYFSLKLSSFTPSQHQVQLEMPRLVNGNAEYVLEDNVSWEGYDFAFLKTSFPQNQLTSTTSFQPRLTSFADPNELPNGVYLDWMEVSYMRQLKARNNQLRFFFTGNRAYFEMAGFSNEAMLALSPTDGRFFEVNRAGNLSYFGDQPTQPATYWVATHSAAKTPEVLKLDASSNLATTSNGADYIILTTQMLYPSATAMAGYHQAQNGFETLIVDIQDVFDQFDYGRPTPLAMRRFVHQTQRWSQKPTYLLLWGDALYPDPDRPRTEWELPSYGNASSDGWLAMQFDGSDDWTEVLALGRIPVRSNEDGLLFLEKLSTYEATPLEKWQKRMMVLVGGREPNEQLQLQSLVLPWSNRALAAPTGMDTLNFFSNTEDPFGIEGAFQDSLRVAFREGASWLTYFGHSAAVTWEIVTDDPKDFNNAPKLPLAISLGCRTGAFAGGPTESSNIPVLGEKLVVGSLNGGIAHWGSTGLGSVAASTQMGGILNEVVFSDTLRTLGQIFQEVKRRYAAPGIPPSLRDHVQYSLIGDPATQLAIPTKADFTMTPSQIRITPQTPIPADSILTISAQLNNLGLVPKDSITVSLSHTAPDGTVHTQTLRTAPFRLSQDVAFSVALSEALVGNNLFRVQVDPENTYTEVSEENNVAERNHVVFSSQVTLLAPNNLGTVPSEGPVKLRVNYLNQDPAQTMVVFQLDTAPTFDTPALKTFSTPAAGSFATWSLDEPLATGPIYYWRAGLETSGEPINWRDAVFTVQESDDQHTWLQEGDLFSLNTLSPTLKRQNNEWQFEQYDVEVKYSGDTGGGQFRGQFEVNGAAFERLGLGFGLLILDGDLGTYKASGSMALYDNNFYDPVSERAELDSLVSLIEEGDYIFIRTRHVGRRSGPEIPEDVKDVFRGLGSTAIDTLTYDNLWLMRTRAGHPEETIEVVPTGTNELQLEAILYFNEPEGQTQSPRIGPARAWESLSWKTELPSAVSEIIVDVLDANSDEVLVGGLTTEAPVDISSIDAEAYPFIRLQATLRDTTQQATPQLLRWGVNYLTVPEIVMDQSSLVLSADTLNESEPLTLSAKVLNLSATPADTIVVTLELTDMNNNTTLVAADTLSSLAADSEASFSFELETLGLLGDNQLTLTAVQPGLPESLTFNNTAITNFTVRGDRVPPALRVTVDGTAYPADPEPIRDLQSPDIPQLPARPTIEVVFSDENPFRLLTDTTLATITLDDKVIPFSSPDVQFEPATEAKNEARIIYTPDFTGEDAVHTLVVTAFDVNGNEAEGSPYQFHFRIATTFALESVYPYPNPMSSFTRFAFLVKGANTALIDDFRIRIYTLSGRVVQEFDLIENPSRLDGNQLRVGWNKLTWDGTDADGDLLAPGVYLYKVYLKADGQEVAVNNESGIEKLVIIR